MRSQKVRRLSDQITAFLPLLLLEVRFPLYLLLWELQDKTWSQFQILSRNFKMLNVVHPAIYHISYHQKCSRPMPPEAPLGEALSGCDSVFSPLSPVFQEGFALWTQFSGPKILQFLQSVFLQGWKWYLLEVFVLKLEMKGCGIHVTFKNTS